MSIAMSLCGRLVEVADLSVDDRRAILALIERYYCGVLDTIKNRLAEQLADADRDEHVNDGGVQR